MKYLLIDIHGNKTKPVVDEIFIEHRDNRTKPHSVEIFLVFRYNITKPRRGEIFIDWKQHSAQNPVGVTPTGSCIIQSGMEI
jgi:hypothetical protein